MILNIVRMHGIPFKIGIFIRRISEKQIYKSGIVFGKNLILSKQILLFSYRKEMKVALRVNTC